MKKRGFTLIELLVTIGISGVLLTVVFASFGSFNKSKRLSEAADGLVTNLRAVATKAVSGDKPVDCTGQLEGYLVILGPAAGYSVQASCLTSSPPATDYTLSNGAEFQSATSLTFYPLDEGVSGEFDINVIMDGLDDPLTVKVATTGAIYIGDLAAPNECGGQADGTDCTGGRCTQGICCTGCIYVVDYSCHPGTSPSYCGVNGSDCVDCGPMTCENGACI